MKRITDFWASLPPKLQASIVAGALLVLGAATELATSWLQGLTGA